MKSYFTKFGAFLLCGVMLAAVGCHDYGEDIQQVNDKVDNLDKNYAVEVEDLEKAIAELDAKYATDTELASKISELQNTVNTTIDGKVAELQNAIGGKADASALSEAIEDLEEAYAAADKTLEDAIALKADATTVTALQTLVNENKAALDALKSEVSAANLTELKANVASLQAGLNTAAAQVETNKNDIETLKSELATAKANISDNAAAIKTLTDANLITRVQAIENAGYVLESALTAKLDALTEAYKAADATLKAELESEIATVSGQITTINNTIGDIRDEIDFIKTTLEDVAKASDLTKAIDDLRTELEGKIADAIEDLEDRVEILEGLVTKIQKVVYIPTSAEGKATLSALKLNDGTYTSAPSKISYKVYPYDLAEEIVKYAAIPGALRFDVVGVTKAQVEPFSIVAIEGNRETGILDITYVANKEQTNTLYDSATESYSAAFVIEKGNDFYSTEYTNITKGTETTISMVLEGELPVGEVYAKEISYANILTNWDVYAGVEPKFVLSTDLTTKYTVEQLNNMGYGVTCEVTTGTPTYSDPAAAALFVLTPVADSYATNVTLKKNAEGTANIANWDNENAWVNVAYTFASNVDLSKTIDGKVTISDFPYTLVLDGYAPQNYELTYVGGEGPHVVLDGITPKFQLGTEQPIDVTALNDLGYAVTVVTSADATAADDATKALFSIVGDDYPLTVDLAKDGDNIKAIASDVDKSLEVSYTFAAPAVNLSVPVTSTVTITKASYTFNLESGAATWTYMADADVEALRYAGAAYSYEREFNAVPDEAAKNDIKYVELPFATQVVEVTCDNAPATGVTVVFAADKVSVSGFEWGKTYEAVGTFEVTTGSVVGAEVTVNFEFTTEARPDFNTPYKVVLDITEYPYTANLELTDEIADDITAVCQLTEANRGEGFDVAQWLEDVFVTYDPVVVNTIAYGDKSFNPDEGWKNNLELSTDGSQVYTKYSYLYEGYQGVMPTEYKYTKEMTTYYGQKIVLEKTLKFTLPTYVINYNEYWVDETTMSSTISPSWVETSGKVSGFTVQNIDMYDAFTLHAKEGEPALDEAAMAAANLSWEFALELDGVAESPLPTIADNVITYNSALDAVGVDSKLYLVNTKDDAVWSKVELATNYSTDFSNYVVNKYDPLLDIEAVPVIEKVLAGPSEDPYTVNLAEHLNLNDKLGRSFIKNGEINTDTYTYDTNFFGLSLDFDVETAKSKIAPNIAAKISIEEVTDIAGNVIDCVVNFTYDVDLALNKDTQIVIPVTYKYTWGETTTEITVEFKK